MYTANNVLKTKVGNEQIQIFTENVYKLTTLTSFSTTKGCAGIFQTKFFINKDNKWFVERRENFALQRR